MKIMAPDKKNLSQTIRQNEEFLEMITEALSDKHRRTILAVLLRHEAVKNEPMSYAELMKKVNLPSNKLAYHLKVLRQAGMVRQLTDLPLENASAKTGYRSFYQTTAFALMVLEALFTHAKYFAKPVISGASSPISA